MFCPTDVVHAHLSTVCIIILFDIFVIRFRGKPDCVVPVTPYLKGIFQHLWKKENFPPRVSTVDMLHILLLLPFLLDGLLEDVVHKHNRKYPL